MWAQSRYLTGIAVAASVLAVSCVHGQPPEAPDPDSMGAGYSSREARSDQTGAVQTVLISENDRARYSTVEQLLQGRVAGLEVLRGADGIHLRIRGTTSIHMSNDPLVVIDGTMVEPGQMQNAFAAITPSAVDRIDVLKDAGSTAIYGVRGAHGVVIITTRRSP